MPHKETGPLDGTCFQLLFEGEILTFRVDSVSEKLQWINQIDSAIRDAQSLKKIPSIANLAPTAGGTLRLKLLNITFNTQARNRNFTYSNVFLVAKIEGQALKSKRFGPRDTSIYQSLIFSVPSAESKLQISVFAFHKYSADGNYIPN